MSYATILIGLIVVSTAFYRSSEAQEDWSPPELECPGDLQIIILEEGEIAPFNGQFFTDDAAACLVGKLEFCVETARDQMGLIRHLWEADIEACEQQISVEIETREEAVRILEEELAETLLEDDPWYESFAFHFSLGILAGVGTGYLIHDLVD